MSVAPFGSAAAHYVFEAAVALVVAVFMDLWAAFLHGWVWHGPLWEIHRSHHAPRAGWFERNDLLSATHAPVAIALILLGCRLPRGWTSTLAFSIGLGMTFFGLVYVLIHDGLVHKRLPVRFLMHIPGMRAVVRAHRVHHAATRASPPFGIILGPLELRRARLTRTSAQREPPTSPPPTDRAPA